MGLTWQIQTKQDTGFLQSMTPTVVSHGSAQLDLMDRFPQLRGSEGRRRLVPLQIGPIGSYSAHLRGPFDWQLSERSLDHSAMESPLALRQQRHTSSRTTLQSLAHVSSLELNQLNATRRLTGHQLRTSPNPVNWTNARLMYTSNTIGR